jgi:hypothetical protein
VPHTSTLLHMEDSRYPTVSIALDAEEASKIAEILLHLAALIDPDDPDGLRDADGRRSERLEENLLTDTQFVMLRHPLYRADQRSAVASQLRVISAKIEGQLPDEAPEVGRR